MSGGRPRTAIGTWLYVVPSGDRCVAETRFRDLDGRLRKVTATAGSASAAKALLKERLVDRTGFGSGGLLSLASPCGDLVALWLADLELRDLADGTKESYRDQVRLHVLPAFEHFKLGEITTGRVEWFLKSQRRSRPLAPNAPGPCSTCCSGSLCATTRSPATPSKAPRPCARPTASRGRLPWSRSPRSAWPQQTGGPALAGLGRSRTARSATSSRSCSVRRCVPARCWHFVHV